MARPSPETRMSTRARQANNMPIAKRAALQYLTSIAAVLRHEDEHFEEKLPGLCLDEARTLFGSWNSAFPTTLQLRQLSQVLEERAANVTPASMTDILLTGMSVLAGIVMRAPLPEQAVHAIAKHHASTLRQVIDLRKADSWFPSFASLRGKEFHKLLSQLR